jgi:hypothetical protein
MLTFSRKCSAMPRRYLTRILGICGIFVEKCQHLLRNSKQSAGGVGSKMCAHMHLWYRHQKWKRPIQVTHLALVLVAAAVCNPCATPSLQSCDCCPIQACLVF